MQLKFLSLILALLAALSFVPTAALAASKLVTAGRDGAFYVSSDDGKTWQRVNSGVSTYVNGVTSDNRGAFVAVGAKGVILRSSDYGKSWAKVTSPVTTTLSAVTFDEVSDRMIAVGSQGVVLRSDDQGKSWKQLLLDTDISLNAVAPDGKGAWVIVGTKGQVVGSTDGADTFTVLASPTVQQLNAVVFAKGRFVAAGVKGTVLTSADRGATWKTANTGSKQVLEGVAVDGNGNILAVGWKGTTLRSNDGGDSWNEIASGTTARLFAVTAFGAKGVLVAGDKGVTARSADGGATWEVSKQRNGSQYLLTVARARLPNLKVDGLALNKACEVSVTLTSTGPARVPPEAWDGRVTLAPEKFAASLPLAAIDPEKKLLVPGGSVTVQIPGAKVNGKATLKVALDPGKALAQTSRGDDATQADVVCEGKAP